jgi:hypothetical protein
MRADNEVSVDRIGLKRAVSWTRRGRQAERDKTLFYFADDGFTVKGPRAITRSVDSSDCRACDAIKAPYGKIAGDQGNYASVF